MSINHYIVFNCLFLISNCSYPFLQERRNWFFGKSKNTCEWFRKPQETAHGLSTMLSYTIGDDARMPWRRETQKIFLSFLQTDISPSLWLHYNTFVGCNNSSNVYESSLLSSIQWYLLMEDYANLSKKYLS